MRYNRRTNPFESRNLGVYCGLCRLNQAEARHHYSYSPDRTVAVCRDCHERIHFGDLWRLDPKKEGNRAIHFFEKFEETGDLDVIISDIDWNSDPEE